MTWQEQAKDRIKQKVALARNVEKAGMQELLELQALEKSEAPMPPTESWRTLKLPPHLQPEHDPNELSLIHI